MGDEKLTVGSVEIVGLTDGVSDFPFPLSALFPAVSSEAWEPYRQRYPGVFAGPDTWRNHWGAYLVRSSGRTLLIDTGIGAGPKVQFLGIEGSLPSELKRHGVDPGSIDSVLMTHLHPDHIGWTTRMEGGSPRLMFPNARYIAHEADWQVFTNPETWKQLPFGSMEENLLPLQDARVLDLVAGERSLTPEVTAIPTPGHTPGHMSVLVRSGGQAALILGDVANVPAQVTETDWFSGFDAEPLHDVLRQTRERIFQQAEDENLTVAACHFPEPGFGRIVRLQGRRYWQAL